MGIMRLDIHIAPTESGIIDGRILAHQLIKEAPAALSPYVGGCPACTDALFSIVANTAIAEQHSAREKTGALPGTLHQVRDVPKDAWHEHLQAAYRNVRAALGPARCHEEAP